MKVQLPSRVINCSNFINNQFCEGSGSIVPVDSPYTGTVIGEFRESTREDVEQAIQVSSEAQKLWSALPIKERSRVLFRWRETLLRQLESICHLIASESGKTFIEAQAEVNKGIEVLEYALSLQNSDLGGRIEVSRGVFCEYRREALGIVANITPFNFPAMVPLWTIPIAIVLGNSYIWKPSEKTPLTSNILAQTFKEAGLPPGVFQVLQGGKATAERLIEHPQVKALGFVGSTPVARSIYSSASAQGKRVLALGGAKNHIVLLPDANLEMSGVGISDSFTGCAGQRCMAASVVLAVGDVRSHIHKIGERAKSLRLGDEMGALISRHQVDYLCNSIDRAVKGGAKIFVDGRNPKVPAEYQNGYWIGPTILTDVSPEMECCTEELFGPVLAIIQCESIAQAMIIQNQNPYGNACSVFTSSGALAEKVIRTAHAGMVGINVGVPVPREPFSFGGIGFSKFGHGDITGAQSLDLWSNTKKITTKWESQNDQTWMS